MSYVYAYSTTAERPGLITQAPIYYTLLCPSGVRMGRSKRCEPPKANL